jgi:atypical dual specificity phosphatase
MTKLNFSWVIDGKLAGHEAPLSKQDLVWLKQQGVFALVRLIEKNKAEVSASQIGKLGMWDLHEPVPDFDVPKPDQIDRIIQFIDTAISAKRPVGVSCKFGIGRTGTILACYLVHKGDDADSAISAIRQKRPSSIETQEQVDAVIMRGQA